MNGTLSSGEKQAKHHDLRNAVGHFELINFWDSPEDRHRPSSLLDTILVSMSFSFLPT